jgi:hypothetical protein
VHQLAKKKNIHSQSFFSTQIHTYHWFQRLN